MGREKRLAEDRVSVGLSPRDLAALRLLAQRDEVSISAVIRRAVRLYLQRLSEPTPEADLVAV